MRALALAESSDHVCARYRVRAFAPALAEAGWSLEVAGVGRDPARRLGRLARARDYDAVVLQRKLLPGWQLDLLRRSACRLVFDFDDAVLYRDSYDPRGPDDPRRLRRFRRTVQVADEVIAGNDFLADCALRCGARADRVHVIPTCVRTDLYEAGRPRGGRAGLDLVWIGSSSTLAGLEARRDIWERVGAELPGCRLRVICDRFPDLGALAVVPVAWSEATEAAELAAADAGVSWVPDDLWSRGKCGLKLLQYMAAGLPVVANPVGVHPTMIDHGVAGFLAETAEEWVRAVRALRDDPARRRAMGAAARRSVEAFYSVAAWSGPFVAAVAGREGAWPRPSAPCLATPGMKGEGVAPGAQARERRAENPGRWAMGPRRRTGGVTGGAGAGPPSDRPFVAPAWEWTRTGDTGWWVRPDWHKILLRDRGLRLDEWKAHGRLTTVKTGPHRAVYRVDLAEGSIFVKHFLVPDVRAMARQWFRRGKGRNEGRRAIKLRGIGVDTIDPIALGEQRKRAFLFENYLITLAIPRTQPLDAFLETTLPRLPSGRASKVRQRLARAIAELTAHLHDAGFVHQDFHPGNLLVRFDEEDRPHLALIDLDALRTTRHVGWRAAMKNLALLNHYFWLRCSRADRGRFLRDYLAARGMDPAHARWFASAIEDSTRRWAERLWRRWGKRCCGTNKYFKTFRRRGSWAIASRDLDRDVAKQVIADPIRPIAEAGATVLKESRTTTVAELTMSVRGRPTPVIYKRFKSKKPFEWLLNIVRPTRAWRAWQAAQHLVARGIATPQNLAIVERTTPLIPIPLETFLVTVKAERARTLGDYIADVLPALGPRDQRKAIRSLTRALARMLRMLHERSISDRDLKASNIMVEGEPTAEEPRMSLIDLVGVQLCHPLPRHRRLQNLARLQVSLEAVPGRTRTDALRFLRLYLVWGLSPLDDWKGLWRQVERLCDRKRERNRHRGRLLS